MMVSPNMTMEEFIARGGDPDDPFTPTCFRRDGGAGAVRPGMTAEAESVEPTSAAQVMERGQRLQRERKRAEADERI